MGLEIRSANTNCERAKFIRLPWRIYRDDSHWVPPIIGEQQRVLDPQKGLFFEYGEARLFLAYRDGRPVGRISAHLNSRYDKAYDDAKGFFGFFECENDQDTARSLLAAAEEYLRGKGRRVIEGPFSFTIYDEVGVLIEGLEDDPYVLTSYNRPYYGSLIESAGYEKSIDWYAFRTRRDVNTPQFRRRLDKVRKYILDRYPLTIRSMANMRNFPFYEKLVHSVFASAWNQNWGHVMLTDAEYDRLKHMIRQIMIPELSAYAEVDGQPVGFALCVYDANEVLRKINGRLFPFGFFRLLTGVKKCKRIRLILMGVLEEFRGRGIESMFYLNLAEQTIDTHFEELEMSLVAESNEALIRITDRLPNVHHSKTYRVFRKQLA